MDYKKFPIFKGISPEAEAYLDRLDACLQKNKIKLEPEEVFIRKVDLYYDFLRERDKKDQSKFAQNIEENLQRQASQHGRVFFPFMIGNIYDQRRNVKNETTMSASEYQNILQNWEKRADGLDISHGDGDIASGWIYKTSPEYWKKRKAGKPIHRFILNVDPNSRLLSHLDDFAKKYGCQYKCAETKHIAYSRPDTIVIYTADERFNEQKNELAKLAAPYVRSNGDELLDGDKIAPGLYTASERDRKDIEQLIKKAQTIYPRLADNLQNTLDQNPSKQHPLSLGQYTIFNDICESMAILKGLKSAEKTQTATSDNEKHTTTSILKEGISGPYSKSEDVLKFSKMPELANTTRAKYKLEPNNPDVMIIEGTDKDGRHTFTLSRNKKTGIYTYQGGHPQKIYSNDPKLNFPPLPETALASFKENHNIALNKAFIKAEMRNGVTFREGDKTISVKQGKVGEHENCFVFVNYSSDGKPLTKFVLDRTTGFYVAQDFKTGEQFTNSPKLTNKKLRELPPEVMKKFQNRIKIAENHILQQRTLSKDNSR